MMIEILASSCLSVCLSVCLSAKNLENEDTFWPEILPVCLLHCDKGLVKKWARMGPYSSNGTLHSGASGKVYEKIFSIVLKIITPIGC
jgi:hypothetical protein